MSSLEKEIGDPQGVSILGGAKAELPGGKQRGPSSFTCL